MEERNLQRKLDVLEHKRLQSVQNGFDSYSFYMRKEEVIEKIGKENWEAFCEFMFGQTVSTYPDGKTDFYDCDVENFIHKMKTGKVLFFD